jgi:hypothetical protein
MAKFQVGDQVRQNYMDRQSGTITEVRTDPRLKPFVVRLSVSGKVVYHHADQLDSVSTTNPHSFKEIIGLALGEHVCADHGGNVRTPISPQMGICYACAVAHGEPLR